MAQHALSRRSVLQRGSLAGAAGLGVAGGATAAEATERHPSGPPRKHHEVVIPWVDQPADIPPPAQGLLGHPLVWEKLDSWRTPRREFFTVKHYGNPKDADLDPRKWRLQVDGLVEHPQSLSLHDLRSRRHRNVDFTLECAGNHGLPFLIGGIGNATWTGTSLARVLREAAPHRDATEVVFWGLDKGTVTIRDNGGVTGGGRTGTTTTDSDGNLDLTITEHFSRSMSLEDALDPANLLTWGMNGQDLPNEHGGPLRLIAPGWYGVANVKWLTRIELRDGRNAGRFMARDYVTIRETKHDGETVWTATTVGHNRLKSVPAKVVRTGDHYRVLGAAWGGAIRRVEVRIDDGPWHKAHLHRRRPHGHGEWSWTFWSYDWGKVAKGKHTVTSRAVDWHGRVQPKPSDPVVANRRTYWENNGQVTRTVKIR